MIITYFRSSFFGDWSYCGNSFFLKNVLGYNYEANHKAQKGTTTHKVLDVLSNVKLALQNGQNFIENDIVGRLEFAEHELYESKILPDDLITEINFTRKDKYIYLSPCQLKSGHTRYGYKLVNKIFDMVYSHYTNSERSSHDWGDKDRNDCLNWVWMALDFNGGLFDPRKKTIFGIEQHFDFVLDYDWAKYNYILPDGRELTGNLAIKGTIDLITKHDDSTLEVVDYKTGQRINWATGKTKNLEDFEKDPQLMLYYYALRKLYPNIKDIIMTIFYIRHGGPFSVCFEDRHLDIVEDYIKSKFKEIQSCQLPVLLDQSQKDFRCNKLCPFYKNKFSENDQMNMCHRIHSDLKTYGLEYTMQTRTNGTFDYNKYNSPGE